MEQSRETHLVCYTCGDVGFGKEFMKACSRCSNSSHPYCMRVIMRDMSEEWMCEECLHDPMNDRNSLKSTQAENVSDSSRKFRFNVGRQVACKRQKAVETGKVKFLPTEEVIKLSSGINSGPKPANITIPTSKRTSMGSKNAGSNARRNLTYLDLDSVKPRGGVQISTSISRQHAVEIPKKTKEDEEKVSLSLAKKHGGANVLHSNNEDAMRSSRPSSSSKQHTTIISADQNFHDAADPEISDVPKTETWNRHKVSLYRRHAPSLHPTWTGGFKFPDTATPGEFYGGFLAQPPCRVHRKAYELLNKMPPVLQVNLLQQCRLQADICKNGCLDLCDIALYFFPADYVESSQKNCKQLIEFMGMKNSVMICIVDDMELLIFTSQQLDADSRDVSTKSNANFFGGFFRRAEENRMKVHRKLPSLVSYTNDANANTDTGEDVDMDIDMVGGKIAGIPDMAVSKESLPGFNNWATKETSDEIPNGKLLTVSEEIGCPGTMQVPASRSQLHGSVEAFGVCRTHTHESIKAHSLQGSQNKHQVKRREFDKDVPHITGSCSVVVKAEVQEAVNDCSASCPSRSLDTVTKSGMQVKAEEHEPKPDEIREKKGLQGPSQVKAEKYAASPGNRETETSLCLGLFPSTRVKLSVAGRSRGNPGAASVGGLIRDESGMWIAGYNLNLGIISTCLASDLWALYHGMKFTRDRGYKKVRVESDSAAAVASLKSVPSHLSADRDLIESCRALINGEWDCKVYAIRREENLCAEWLATNAKGHPLEMCRHYVPPSELIQFLENDYK